MLNRTFRSGNRDGIGLRVEGEVSTGTTAERGDRQQRAERQEEEQQCARYLVSQLANRSETDKTKHPESNRQLIS